MLAPMEIDRVLQPVEVILDVVEQAEEVLERISRADLHGEVANRLRRLAISILCLLQEPTSSTRPPETPGTAPQGQQHGQPQTPSIPPRPPRSPDRVPPVKCPPASTRRPLPAPAKSAFAKATKVVRSPEVSTKCLPRVHSPSLSFNPKDLTGRVRKITDLYFAYGGFSEVYKGIYRDESGLPHDVAIKVIRGVTPTESNKAALFKRLDREAKVWHTLEHPNVLEFLGIVRNMGSFFGLVSPYCAKGYVTGYLDDNPQSDRLDLILGVAKGIEYLHEKEVIHGDIKGSNVLIANDGRPLLCDFGRSRIINYSGQTTNNMAGSLRYMAPELIERDVEPKKGDHVEFLTPFLTKATDVYAFSILSVEILSGQQPYPKIHNDMRITFKVPEGLRPSRDEYQLSVLHEKIWDILELCWVKNPAERLTISDLIQRLSNIR